MVAEESLYILSSWGKKKNSTGTDQGTETIVACSELKLIS